MNIVASSFDTSAEVGFTKNRVWYNVKASAGWASAHDYSLKAQVWSDNFGDLIVETNLSPNIQGIAQANLHSILQSFVEPQIPSLAWTGINITENPQAISLRLYETINGTDNTFDIADKIHFIRAGFDYENESLALEKTWIENGKFLTNAVHPKPTSTDSPEWLYWFGGLQDEAVTIRVEVFFNDGSSITYDQFSGNTNGKIIAIPSSYEALGIELATPTGLEVLEWTIEVVGKSEIFRYELTDLNCLEKTILVYENSLGGFDTLFSDGNLQTNALEVKKQVARKYLPRNYQLSDGEYFVSAISGKRKGISGTGWLSPEWAKSLQELQLSENVYIVKDNKLLPVTVSISDNYYKKDSSLLGFKVQYDFLFDVRAFTNITVRG